MHVCHSYTQVHLSAIRYTYWAGRRRIHGETEKKKKKKKKKMMMMI